MLLVDEAGDLAGDAHRVTGGVEAGDGSDAAAAAQHRVPPGPRPQAVGRGDADAGDECLAGSLVTPLTGSLRGRCPRIRYGPLAHAASFSRGRVSTVALWNPPKPLATLSTVLVRCSRANNGV